MDSLRDIDATPTASETPGYRPPTVTRLGTLAELTQGGTVGPDDGLGGQGDGSLL
ncbi:lasso RiPP family leader peptide-containing protein [Micromonospora sp. S-DT3-3-22]|uniref:lasso RiPP family leader peptide-containing protein n=1 Tax=Micromonospora sp. S-DT3-3-22 TaxID=2755359 RepID=UPI00188FB4BA|nr:lasso RiPP family leader peptide-containing protein [Micromonospora sp. S-DT3-3-22]